MEAGEEVLKKMFLLAALSLSLAAVVLITGLSSQRGRFSELTDETPERETPSEKVQTAIYEKVELCYYEDSSR